MIPIGLSETHTDSPICNQHHVVEHSDSKYNEKEATL
jgi:hypothetical protein